MSWGPDIIFQGGKYCSTYQTPAEKEYAFSCLIRGCPGVDSIFLRKEERLLCAAQTGEWSSNRN